MAIEYPEGWEEWVAFLTTHLPEPIQQEVVPSGVIFFTAGDPPEVVVRLSPSSITVSTCASELDGVVLRPQRLGTIVWRRLPAGRVMALVAELIASARERRQATYRQCFYCEQMKPPEQMHEEDVCVECANVAGNE